MCRMVRLPRWSNEMGAKTDPKSARRGRRVHSFRVFGSMDFKFKLQETFRFFPCLSNETWDVLQLILGLASGSRDELLCGVGVNIFWERLTSFLLSAFVLPIETAIHVVGGAPFPTVWCLCPAAVASTCKLWDTFGPHKLANSVFTVVSLVIAYEWQSMSTNDCPWIFWDSKNSRLNRSNPQSFWLGCLSFGGSFGTICYFNVPIEFGWYMS